MMECYQVNRLQDFERFRFGQWLHSLGVCALEGYNSEIESLMVNQIVLQTSIDDTDKKLGLLSTYLDIAIMELSHYQFEGHHAYSAGQEMVLYEEAMPKLARDMRAQALFGEGVPF